MTIDGSAELSGKVAIVTGASRGIGKAIAVGLTGAGVRVVLAARSEVRKEGGLEGTIHETASAVESLGGVALAVRKLPLTASPTALQRRRGNST